MVPSPNQGSQSQAVGSGSKDLIRDLNLWSLNSRVTLLCPLLWSLPGKGGELSPSLALTETDKWLGMGIVLRKIFFLLKDGGLSR